jgi:hypothetical protein
MVAEARRLDDRAIDELTELVATTLALEPEFDAAVTWTRTAAPDLNRELVGWLAAPYHYAGLLSRIAVDLDDSVPHPRALVNARRIHALALLCGTQTPELALREGARAVEIMRTEGDDRWLARSLYELAHVAVFADPESGVGYATEAAALAGDDQRLQLRIQLTLASNLQAAGRIAEAEALVGQILAVAPPGIVRTFALTVAGDCALADQRFDAALEHYGHCLASLRHGATINALLQCYGIASSLAGLERDAEATELMAALEVAGERDHTIRIVPDFDPDQGPRLAAARDRLSPTRRAEVTRRGRALDLEALVARALDLAAVPTPR